MPKTDSDSAAKYYHQVWHTLTCADIVTHFHSSEQGLSQAQAEQAQQQFGLNALPEAKSANLA